MMKLQPLASDDSSPIRFASTLQTIWYPSEYGMGYVLRHLGSDFHRFTEQTAGTACSCPSPMLIPAWFFLLPIERPIEFVIKCSCVLSRLTLLSEMYMMKIRENQWIKDSIDLGYICWIIGRYIDSVMGNADKVVKEHAKSINMTRTAQAANLPSFLNEIMKFLWLHWFHAFASCGVYIFGVWLV